MNYDLASFFDLATPEASSVFEVFAPVSIAGRKNAAPIKQLQAYPSWQANVAIAPLAPPQGEIVLALLDWLVASNDTFEFSDPVRPYPLADPDGAAIGAATPTISTIGADNSSCAFANLPSGYQLTAGDKFHIDVGTRRTLHRIRQSATANGSGDTPTIGIWPSFPPGMVTVNDPVFSRPAARMTMTERISPQRNGAIYTGGSYKAVQAL